MDIADGTRLLVPCPAALFAPLLSLHYWPDRCALQQEISSCEALKNLSRHYLYLVGKSLVYLPVLK
jgi:hypothetical protein